MSVGDGLVLRVTDPYTAPRKNRQRRERLLSSGKWARGALRGLRLRERDSGYLTA